MFSLVRGKVLPMVGDGSEGMKVGGMIMVV